ncbi:MAG: tetratricopeptide repeat protein [Bacteroidota bacterium]
MRLLRFNSFLSKLTSSLILAGLLMLSNVYAQTPIRVPVADVKQEEVFINAQLEKLLGNYEKAEELFRAILESHSDEATIYFSFAQVLSQLNKDEEAVKMAEKAVELDKANLWYKVYLTEIYEKAGDDLKAAAIYEALAKSEPDKEEYYNSWAFYLIRAQKIEEAIAVYNAFEKRIGVTESLIRKKHTLYLGLGDTKKAGKELVKLAAAFPNDLAYQHLLAAFYTNFEQPEKAQMIYKNILKINPDDASALMALKSGENNGKEDDYADLKRIFEKPNIEIDAKIKELLPLIEEAIEDNNPTKLNATLSLAETLVKTHPEEAKANAAYGDLLYHSNKLEEAKLAYQKTISLEESVYPVWQQLMYIHLKQNDYEALEKVSEEAVDIFPNQARVYLMNGLALNQLGDYDDAIAILQEASYMVGSNQQLKLDLLTQMAMTYENKKQFSDADKNFQQALEIAPNSVALLNTYSYALAERAEQLPKAELMIKKAMKAQPNQAYLEHTYAWVLHKKKDQKEAQKWIEKALEKQETALFVEHYGDILLARGEKAAALGQWKKAQELGSKSKNLEQKILGQS